jgi:hypothetical protein
MTVTAGGTMPRHWPGLAIVHHTAARDQAWPNDTTGKTHHSTSTTRHNHYSLLLAFVAIHFATSTGKVTMAMKRVCLVRINTSYNETSFAKH